MPREVSMDRARRCRVRATRPLRVGRQSMPFGSCRFTGQRKWHTWHREMLRVHADRRDRAEIRVDPDLPKRGLGDPLTQLEEIRPGIALEPGEARRDPGETEVLGSPDTIVPGQLVPGERRRYQRIVGGPNRPGSDHRGLAGVAGV